MNAVRSIYGRPQLALDPVLMCAAQSAAADATLGEATYAPSVTRFSSMHRTAAYTL